MPADPVEAGRKGGRSRSAAKLAAARRNGFQPRPKPETEQPDACVQTEPQPVAAAAVDENPVSICGVRPAYFLVATK